MEEETLYCIFDRASEKQKEMEVISPIDITLNNKKKQENLLFASAAQRIWKSKRFFLRNI